MSFIHRRVAPLLFPSILWHANGQAVHLTFDDGPHPVATPRVLEILRDRKLKATFFLLGTNVTKYPDLARAIGKEGHCIGNHSSVHANMIFRTRSWQEREIDTANAIIKETTGVSPQFFRPPFGWFGNGTLKAAVSQAMRVVLWDVDSKDYAGSGSRTVIRRVLRQATPGSIILFHDNDSTSENIPEYLNPILDDFQQRNTKFSTLKL
jgi:peptidoglycan-N-acetylglucosamine deacetylase